MSTPRPATSGDAWSSSALEGEYRAGEGTHGASRQGCAQPGAGDAAAIRSAVSAPLLLSSKRMAARNALEGKHGEAQGVAAGTGHGGRDAGGSGSPIASIISSICCQSWRAMASTAAGS